MSEPAHTTGLPGLSAASVSDRDADEAAAVDHADSDERTQTWEAPQEASAWPEESAAAEPEESPTLSEERTSEFVPPLPDAEDRLGGRAEGQRANHLTGIWIGLVLIAGGFAAIFFSWSKVAGLTNVAQQVPYLVSSGLLGLALVIVGAVVVDVFVRRWDSGQRKDQLAQMTAVLSEVRELLEYEPTIEPGEDQT